MGYNRVIKQMTYMNRVDIFEVLEYFRICLEGLRMESERIVGPRDLCQRAGILATESDVRTFNMASGTCTGQAVEVVTAVL
jgi:hypothetical protein